MARKKNSLPFDQRGGKLVVQRRLLESEAYRGLSLAARCLLLEMQTHWSNTKPVDFGTREAAARLGCDRRVAMRAFKELLAAGFIQLEDEALFNSRTGSRSRSWILTWLPYNDKFPTNDWEAKKSSST
jgi:hypothetical protein